MSAFTKTFVLAALAATSTAHMVMREPKPFPNSIGGFGLSDPENSPLNEDGSNYPCHMVGPYTADFTNTMELGSTQTLAFMGSAVHGGGSCQVSITYDESPTKQSVFKVIHSIEGGCPAKNQAGNLSPSDRMLIAPDTYSFKLPDDIPAGKAVLAWTWFNRVGNREMYMNCAPITLTGSGGDISNFNALPDIMVANIGEKQCTVAEGQDVKFPNPGNSVDQFPFGEYQDVSSQPACAYNWMAGSGPGSATPPTGGSEGDSGSGSGSGEYPSVDPAPSATIPGGVFITADPDASSSAPAEATTTPAASPSAPIAAPAKPSPPPASGDSPTGGSEGGACTDGNFNCSGSAFQQCVNGAWSVSMPMAPGTSCTPGVSNSLNIYASKTKKGRRAVSFRA